MSRKSRKIKAEEEPPPESSMEEILMSAWEEPPEPPPEPKPEPPQAPAQEVTAPEQPACAPQADDELPPPPSDIAEKTKRYPPIVTRKPGIGAALKRAGVIFGKDVGTMAKHGLVSSVILLAFLLVIFYISSYAMFMLVTTSMEEGDGDGGPNLGNDGSLVANAGDDVTVTAGMPVTLSSAATVHRANLMYVEWRIDSQDASLPKEISLYGPQVTYRFDAAGTYTVDLTVVDADWNMDEDNMTVTVDRSSGDTEPPMIIVEMTPLSFSTYGTPVVFNATNSTDNVEIVNWTWVFDDIFDRLRYGPVVSYVFECTGNHQATLIARDAAGNAARNGGSVEVNPSTGDNLWPYATVNDLPQSVNIGDQVYLDASGSTDDQGISEYVWYVKLNDTMIRLTGPQASFTARGFGMYEIIFVAKDQAGNAAIIERSVLSLSTGMEMPSEVSWTSTPLGQDVPLNVLTFVYGASLLACVIYIGGLFSKGFAHEIQKGTAKTLFFAPVSVTNMVFAKMLYPLAIGPAFIFPLILVSMLPLKQPASEVFMVALVSYLLVGLVMASAAYGSCLIYAATKRMSIKPTALARSFMYLSLVATVTIFAAFAFLLDQWTGDNTWTEANEDLGPKVAMFSPFHQGGVLLSNMLLGSAQSPDWIMFVIPLALIAGGVVVSLRLYPDLFSRE